jgi:ABC-type uncharacterized transport system permease subunit
MLFSLTIFNTLTVVSALLYIIGACLIVVSLNSTEPTFKSQRQWVLISAILAIVIHTSLVAHSYSVNQIIANDLFSMLSLVFLVIGLLFIISAANESIETLSIIIFPFSALAVLLNFNNASPPLPTSNLDGGLQAHIILSVLSYSLLTVAAFQSILLSLQEKQLHNRHPSRLINCLPPMQLMESLLFRTIFLGMLLLTFALASGFIFLDDIFAQHLVHKTFLSIIAWVLFAALLGGRYFFGWRGQKAVKWTYGGYFALMLAYFGSKFVLQMLLNQG